MKGAVYCNGILAGVLEKTDIGTYTFSYDPAYLVDANAPPISLTLPKINGVHSSNALFPFFVGLLSEGVNKDIQCRLLKIDEHDDFRRLLETAGEDTIGAITVNKMNV